MDYSLRIFQLRYSQANSYFSLVQNQSVLVLKTPIISTFSTVDTSMLVVAIYTKTEYTHWRHQLVSCVVFNAIHFANTFCEYSEMTYINLYSNIILIVLYIRFDVLTNSLPKCLVYMLGSSRICLWIGWLLLTLCAQFGLIILGNTIGQIWKHKILLGISSSFPKNSLEKYFKIVKK